MRIKSEQELLKEDVRREILGEIQGGENYARKKEAFKRFECYRDKTSKYTLELLKQQFDDDTVREMAYALANISLVRKVIDKLSRVYSNGVRREYSGNELATENLNKLEGLLEFNTKMKQTNKFLKLQKNCALYIKPCPTDLGWELRLQPLNPYLYDVIEDYYDRTKPMVYILSAFKEGQGTYYATTNLSDNAAREGRESSSGALRAFPQGDNKDQKIADSPNDVEPVQYIWWSKNYHFTTDATGAIIESPEDMLNPISEIPVINFAIDQDNAFWAQGGYDLTDGGIMVNSMVTNINHIAVTQGYGLFWMSGENLPRNVRVGPNKGVLMEYKKDEQAEPKLGFESANPDLNALRSLVEMYVALLLTTNNLSVSSVSSQLTGGVSAPSGISLLIDKAESMEDVEDQRSLFMDKERDVWRVIAKWIDAYGVDMSDSYRNLALPVQESPILKFNNPTVLMSESEKLDALKKRQELGIDTKIDLIMRDNPDMNKEQAEQKLKEIMEEDMQAMASRMVGVQPNGDNNNQDDSNAQQDS